MHRARDPARNREPPDRAALPPPYGDDTERNEGYAALAGPELVEHRLEALVTVRTVLRSEAVTEDQFMAWMRSLNDLRLVLGTMMDITEDDHGGAIDPRHTEAFAVYELLGGLLEQTVSALTHGLDP
ncbi:MAG: DUF2017 domain-containing protein [Microthrixaceae bacterium]|nr:DUF2017 domain-containing protein [Microthrixaceae bacterium]